MFHQFRSRLVASCGWRSLTRRWLSRILIGGLLGLCLAMGLHGCETSATSSSASAEPAESMATVTPEKADLAPSPLSSAPSSQATSPLSPETAALLASIAPNGIANPPRGDLRLVVISDLNSAYGSTDYDPEVDRAIALLPVWQPDMVVCSGDMVAGQNLSLPDAQLRAMWNAFDQHITAPLRQGNIPFGFTMGNHDASGAINTSGNFTFQRERLIAADYWRDPSHLPGVEFVDRFDYPFYFSFKLGDIFFLTWDGSSHRIPSDKLAWVEQALASPAAQSAKLRIVLGHLPLYGIAQGRNQPGEVMSNAEQLRALFERYSVHTYISGHHHVYYPGHRGNLQLLHTGALGSGPRRFIDRQDAPRKTLTVVDVSYASPELTRYTSYDMQTLQAIANQELPRMVVGHNGLVLRRDLELTQLTPEERAACQRRLDAALCAA